MAREWIEQPAMIIALALALGAAGCGKSVNLSGGPGSAGTSPNGGNPNGGEAGTNPTQPTIPGPTGPAPTPSPSATGKTGPKGACNPAKDPAANKRCLPENPPKGEPKSAPQPKPLAPKAEPAFPQPRPQLKPQPKPEPKPAPKPVPPSTCPPDDAAQWKYYQPSCSDAAQTSSSERGVSNALHLSGEFNVDPASLAVMVDAKPVDRFHYDPKRQILVLDPATAGECDSEILVTGCRIPTPLSK